MACAAVTGARPCSPCIPPSTACHLHFSLKKNGASSDPMEYIGWNKEAKTAEKENTKEN